MLEWWMDFGPDVSAGDVGEDEQCLLLLLVGEEHLLQGWKRKSQNQTTTHHLVVLWRKHFKSSPTSHQGNIRTHLTHDPEILESFGLTQSRNARGKFPGRVIPQFYLLAAHIYFYFLAHIYSTLVGSRKQQLNPKNQLDHSERFFKVNNKRKYHEKFKIYCHCSFMDWQAISQLKNILHVD